MHPLYTQEQQSRASRLRWGGYSLLILAYMLGYFHRMAPAVLSAELQTAFHASGTALGVLSASYFYAYTIMQIPSGVLADTLGARSVVGLGCLVAGLGALVFGLTDHLWLACVGRFFVGIGVSVTFIAILKYIAQWFPDRQFATLIGLTILLGNIGGLTASVPLAWAMDYISWRKIIIALAVVSLLASMLVAWVVRNKPTDAGLSSMQALKDKSAHDGFSGTWWQGLLMVLKNKDTWPCFFINLGLGGSFFSLAGLWGVPFLRDIHGFDRAVAASHTSMLMIGFATGSMLLGMLSDRLGRRRPAMLAFMFAFFACWVSLQMAVAMPQWVSMTTFFLLGFFVTGYTITLSVVKEVNLSAHSGMATGVVNTAPFLGGAVLQPLVGIIMDWTWKGGVTSEGIRIYTQSDYRAGFAVLSIFLVVSLVSAFWIRETYCRSI